MSKKNKNQTQKQQSKSTDFLSTKPSSKVDVYLILLGIIILAVSLIRYRLAPMPLERDEGEYAYMGKLILDGIPPYKEAYNMKLPGTYYMYALLMTFFGKTFTGIHTGLMVMNAATMIVLFFALKRLFNVTVGLITATSYGVMSIGLHFLGFAAHATHFVSFYVALAVFFFSKYSEQRSLLQAALTGLMFGMAFLMKQQSVFFIVFGGMMILIVEFVNKPLVISKTIFNTLAYSIGVFIPYLTILLIMILSGNFDKFWFWTIEYASKYADGVPWEEGKKLLDMTFSPIWNEYKLIWFLAFAGFIILFIGKYSLTQKFFAAGFAVFAFASVCPGFYFRQHYFISLLPAVGLMAGITLDYLGKLVSQKSKLKLLTFLPVIILALITANTFAKNKPYYFKMNPRVLCRTIYGTNPFTESVEIAKYINQNSTEKDKIAVLGSEPQIYLYSGRNSATGYLYTYGLMEIHDYNKKMQQEMIAEIEQQKPRFLVFCKVGTSWLARPGSPMDIFDWFNKYSQENYELVGIADISQTQSQYYWNNEAKTHQPQSQEYVMVFKRRV